MALAPNPSAAPDHEPGASSDYSRIADLYDATRNVPADVLREGYARARRADLLPAAGLVLDAGCGTGQMSLPLAAMGYDIRGYDLSAAMAEVARRKVGSLRARYAVADVKELPEADATFDAVVVGKLFQHVGGWERGIGEVVRVLKPGCCLFLIDERGGFKSPVREHLGRLVDAAGFAVRLPGTRDPDEIARAVAEAGCDPVSFDASGLTWENEISFGETLDQLKARTFAEFWAVPDEAYEQAIAETEAWIETQPGGRANAATIRPQLSIVVFRKRAPDGAP